MKHLLALLLVVGSFTCGALTLGACRADRHTPEVKVETVTLAITGMMCAVNCPPKVRAALESVPGVEGAQVDYDTRTATVRCAATCDRAALVAALQKQGFGGAPR